AVLAAVDIEDSEKTRREKSSPCGSPARTAATSSRGTRRWNGADSMPHSTGFATPARCEVLLQIGEHGHAGARNVHRKPWLLRGQSPLDEPGGGKASELRSVTGIKRSRLDVGAGDGRDVPGDYVGLLGGDAAGLHREGGAVARRPHALKTRDPAERAHR